MDCIFCKIINNEIPSFTIYEDDIVKVFLDISPSSNGHSLIIPKKHYTNLVDIDMDTLTHINKVTKVGNGISENTMNAIVNLLNNK